MNRVHPRHGAPGPLGDKSRLFFLFVSARSDQREMEFREEQGAFPSATWERGNTALRRSRRSGFTLLEMVMVLVIIAILAGLSMPAMQSAFTEQAVRRDTHQLALMVKTAMIQSAEQHRAYAIDLTSSTMALHPVGQAPADPDAPATTDDEDASANNSAIQDVEVTSELDPQNRLLTPDPQKANAWIAMPDGTQWIFEPGELCPATRVRLKRGEAWLEMSFNGLTGNVEDEAYSLP